MNEKIVSQALRRGEDCPALDELIERLAANDREVESHVAGCAHCTTEMALFREFQEPAIRPEEKADIDAVVARLRQRSAVPKKAWWPSFGWLAPASLAMAAVLVGLFVWSPGRTQEAPPVSGNEDVMRSARMAVVGPTGTMAETPAKLAWSAVPGAAKYQVSLDEVDRTAVWSGTVESTSAVLPAEVLRQVVPRKTFTWKVVALNAAGAVIAESGAQKFRVERP